MTKLPTQLKHEGRNLELIERDGNLAIYSAGRDGESSPAWIVAKIAISRAGEINFPNGKIVICQEAERLPKENSFGKTGWFFRDFESAMQKYRLELCATRSRTVNGGTKQRA